MSGSKKEEDQTKGRIKNNSYPLPRKVEIESKHIKGNTNTKGNPVDTDTKMESEIGSELRENPTECYNKIVTLMIDHHSQTMNNSVRSKG